MIYTLHQNLKMNNLKEKQIKSDNNCQFHAIIDQCLQNGITGWTHYTLRDRSVNWLEKNRNVKVENIELREMFGLDDDYLKLMRLSNKVWGDEATLFAMAQIFSAKIMVYSSLKINSVYNIMPISGEFDYTFHIGYYNNIHYVSTLPCYTYI